jgi:hypothetical protein
MTLENVLFFPLRRRDSHARSRSLTPKKVGRESIRSVQVQSPKSHDSAVSIGKPVYYFINIQWSRSTFFVRTRKTVS